MQPAAPTAPKAPTPPGSQNRKVERWTTSPNALAPMLMTTREREQTEKRLEELSARLERLESLLQKLVEKQEK